MEASTGTSVSGQESLQLLGVNSLVFMYSMTYFSEVSQVSEEALQCEAVSWAFPPSGSQPSVLEDGAGDGAPQDDKGR